MNDYEDPRNAENLQDFQELPLRKVSDENYSCNGLKVTVTENRNKKYI